MNETKARESFRWQSTIAVAAVSILVSLALTFVVKATGDLDQTFGFGGKITTDFSAQFDAAYDIAVQADGKIVVAGVTEADTGSAPSNFGLARYNSDGSLDTSFGNGGKVSTDFFGNYDAANSLAIQSDGKIIVVGTSSIADAAPSDFAIARYESNGTLDSTFGTGGKVTSDFFTNNDAAKSVAIQSDNKIVVAGVAYNPSNSNTDYALARYHSDGSLDNTFDGDGKVTTHISGYDYVTSVAIYPGGRIVAAGYSAGFSNNEDFSMARYNSNGSLDTSFEADGKVQIDIYGIFRPDKINSIVIQPDGKILAAGNNYISINPITTTFAIARFKEDGNLDSTFGGGDGTTFTQFFSSPNQCCSTGEEVATDIALATDGKIVVAGYTTLGNFTLTRYLNDGSLDTNFGSRGRLFTQLGTYYSKAYAVAIQSDGKLIAVGSHVRDIASSSNFALSRYEANPKSIAIRSDFDLDGKSDISVFRPSDGTWYTLNSTNGSVSAQRFGTSGDIAAPGDYDGDGGGTDYAVFRPSTGTWYILQSSNGAFRSEQFGINGDVPVALDYDGDGKTDVAVFRPSEGAWYIRRSSDNGFQSQLFGISTDRPVQGYYDSDSKADIAVFRESIGRWFILQSATDTLRTQVWGASGDIPVAADYDGDAKIDVGIFRPSNGFWYINSTTNGAPMMIEWGVAGDKPVPADYNGDFKTDVAVWRPGTGYWHIFNLPSVGTRNIKFGTNGDMPVANAYLP